jgi:hypothetical protein
MSAFMGYFIWGLMLAAPLWWLAWRFRVAHWLPRLRSHLRRRSIRLPSQLQPLVILGNRQHESSERHP